MLHPKISKNSPLRAMARWTVMVSGCLSLSMLLISCSHPKIIKISDGPPLQKRDVSLINNPTPHHLVKHAFANPESYVVFGKRYHVLKTAAGYDRRGMASWYGRKFRGKLTSSGEPYNLYAMTAANKVLPLPCYAEVTNLHNQKKVIVKINDRGPFAKGRIIDLSYAAAKKLDMLKKGTAYVEVRAITHFGHTKPKHARTIKNIHAHLKLATMNETGSHHLTKLKANHRQLESLKEHHPQIKKQISDHRQIGAFYKYSNALRVYKIQNKIGRHAYIRASQRHGRTLYHVSIKNPT